MKQLRWIGAAIGVGVALFDIGIAAWIGVDFAVSGRDVTLGVFLYLAATFAFLGWLVGYLIEMRRRDRESSELIEGHMRALQDTQLRLAQHEKLATLGQLASAIAHELRNPLAIIRSTVQNVEESLPEGAADAREGCVFVTEEVDRLNHVTSTLLGFVRPLTLRRDRVDVEELLERVALMGTQIVQPRRIRLDAKVADVGAINADPDLATQVILGLVSNAADASPDGSVIRLRAERREGTVRIAVEDQGSGIPAELREKIFEPFFTTRDEGTGLGLAVARQIVKAHGGDIDLESGASGTTFWIDLPEAA